MKRRFAFTTAAALCGLFAVSVAALAAKPDDPGSGGGGNAGGQGGGKPTTDVYAEMVIVDRDVNGVPIMTDGLGPKDKVGLVPWPIMLGPKDGCPLWNDDTGPVLGEELLSAVEFPSVYWELEIEAYRIPFVDYEIPAEYAGCTTEADVGRLSVVRAPEDVLDRALLEMVNTLSQADDPGEPITLDAAGRLVVTYYNVDDVLVSKTIDAPAENVAAFQRILEQAALYHEDAVNDGAAIVLPGANDAQGLQDRTAAMLGAAADKFGHVGLDDVIYVTQILTIAGDMNTDATELFGGPWSDALGGKYFDFSAFSYDRSETYDGKVCYLKVTSVEKDPNELPVDMTGQIVKEPIMGLIFNEGSTGTNAYGYAKAVDDARAVIFWTHEHPVPVDLIEYCELEAGDAVAVRADTTPSRLYQQ
jgi:hypothetical protein